MYNNSQRRASNHQHKPNKIRKISTRNLHKNNHFSQHLRTICNQVSKVNGQLLIKSKKGYHRELHLASKRHISTVTLHKNNYISSPKLINKQQKTYSCHRKEINAHMQRRYFFNYIRQRIALSQNDPRGVPHQYSVAVHLGDTSISAAVGYGFDQIELVPNSAGTFHTPCVGYVNNLHPTTVYPSYQPFSEFNQWNSYTHLRELLGHKFPSFFQSSQRTKSYSLDPKTRTALTSDNVLTISDIYSAVINSVINDIKSYIGHISLSQVVFTIPDTYTPQKRLELTNMLQKQCKIPIPKLITESVSTCLAYNLGKYTNQRIVVVHPTDNSITVTLLHTNNGIFTTLATIQQPFENLSDGLYTYEYISQTPSNTPYASNTTAQFHNNINNNNEGSSSSNNNNNNNNTNQNEHQNEHEVLLTQNNLHSWKHTDFTNLSTSEHSRTSHKYNASISKSLPASLSSSFLSKESSYCTPDECIIKFIQQEVWFTCKIDIFRHPQILMGCVSNLSSIYDNLMSSGLATIRIDFSSLEDNDLINLQKSSSLSSPPSSIPFHDITLTQDQYYSLIRPAMSPYLQNVITKLLTQTFSSPSDIHHVVLSGESSHYGLVLDDLETLFGKTPLYHKYTPITATTQATTTQATGLNDLDTSNIHNKTISDPFSPMLSTAKSITAKNVAANEIVKIIPPLLDQTYPTTTLPTTTTTTTTTTTMKQKNNVFPQFSSVIGAAKHATLLTNKLHNSIDWETLPMTIGMRLSVPQPLHLSNKYSSSTNVEKSMPLIPAGATLPFTQFLTLSTTKTRQHQISIELLHGERILADDNAFIGKLQLTGLPLSEAGVETVKVGVTADNYGHVNIFMQSLSIPTLISSASFSLPQYTPQQEVLLLNKMPLFASSSSIISHMYNNIATTNNMSLLKSLFFTTSATFYYLYNKLKQNLLRGEISDISHKVTYNDLVTANITLDPLRFMSISGRSRIMDVMALIDPKFPINNMQQRNLIVMQKYFAAEEHIKDSFNQNEKNNNNNNKKNKKTESKIIKLYDSIKRGRKKTTTPSSNNNTTLNDDIDDNNNNSELNKLLRELRIQGLSPLTAKDLTMQDDPSIDDQDERLFLRQTKLPIVYQERLRAKMYNRCIAMINAGTLFIKHNSLWFNNDELQQLQQRIDVANTMLREPQPKFAEIAAVNLGRTIKNLSTLFIQRRERLHDWRVTSREKQKEIREKRHIDFFLERINRRKARAQARERARLDTRNSNKIFNPDDWLDTDDETDEQRTKDFFEKERQNPLYDDTFYYDSDEESYAHRNVPREIYTPMNGWERPILQMKTKPINTLNPVLSELDPSLNGTKTVVETVNEDVINAQWRAQRILSANGIHLNTALEIIAPELSLSPDYNPNSEVRKYFEQKGEMNNIIEENEFNKLYDNNFDYDDVTELDKIRDMKKLTIEQLQKRLEDDPLDELAQKMLDQKEKMVKIKEENDFKRFEILEKLKNNKDHLISTSSQTIPRWIPSRYDAVNTPSELHSEYFDALARQIRSSVFSQNDSHITPTSLPTSSSSPNQSNTISSDTDRSTQQRLKKLFSSDYDHIMEKGYSSMELRNAMQNAKDEWGILITDIINDNRMYREMRIGKKQLEKENIDSMDDSTNDDLSQSELAEIIAKRKEHLQSSSPNAITEDPRKYDKNYIKTNNPFDRRGSKSGQFANKSYTDAEILYYQKPSSQNLINFQREKLAKIREAGKAEIDSMLKGVETRSKNNTEDVVRRLKLNEAQKKIWEELQALNEGTDRTKPPANDASSDQTMEAISKRMNIMSTLKEEAAMQKQRRTFGKNHQF